jgi:hypothetical protein
LKRGIGDAHPRERTTNRGFGPQAAPPSRRRVENDANALGNEGFRREI